MSRRVFLLSPANCTGRRAAALVADGASSELACRLRSEGGAPIGDVFSHVSALYFRGKLAYARRFGAADVVRVITPHDGLWEPDRPIRRRELAALAGEDVNPANPRYRAPLARDVARLADADQCVLLGSIATDKYASVLLDAFGERLVFPHAFVGRGDMSRGGLLLRHAASGVELDYVALLGAVRHGPRPPRLT